MDATADGNTAYLADKDGALEVVDTRQAADAKPAAVSDTLGIPCVNAVHTHFRRQCFVQISPQWTYLTCCQSHAFQLHTQAGNRS